MNIQIIAKRYASAFFSEVKGISTATNIWQELDNLACLMNTSCDFASVVKSPLITDSEKLNVFSALNKSGRISPILFNFIALLIEKKRLFLLSDINQEIRNILLQESGQVEVEAIFAVKPDREAMQELEKKLANITGKKVILKEIIDSTIIGGVKVRVGSFLYDATIKGQLDKLKAALV